MTLIHVIQLFKKFPILIRLSLLRLLVLTIPDDQPLPEQVDLPSDLVSQLVGSE
jgi:hypothetical protein